MELVQTRLLDHVDSPDDVRALSITQLQQLAEELREFIISHVSKTGGHLSPNLGTIELTLALFKTTHQPQDRIVWDVGHQTYAYKILTGRRDAFATLRQHGGLSGFLKREESPYDAFGAGHASTSISAALGFAVARDLRHQNNRVFAVIGDGSLTGGMAFEALNNAGARQEDFTVILNDNKMSISHNVGALSKHLNRLITDPRWLKLRGDVWESLGRLDKLGKGLAQGARLAVGKLEEALKGALLPASYFENLGIQYFGPVDGHDIPALVDVLERLKKVSGPKLLHVVTQKGKGYEPAERDAVGKWHGLGAFDKDTGKLLVNPDPRPTYTQVFGETLVDLMEKDSSVVALTAAMPSGTGISIAEKRFPERVFDVGIAEQHGVTFAAGLACEGLRPVVAIYSTFLQRAYDQVVHDVATQHLPVIFCLDRAGVVGADGPTHHGALDLAYMRSVQGMVVMAPKDEGELRDMLWTAHAHVSGPVSIRYPRGAGNGSEQKALPQVLEMGVPEVLRKGSRVALLGIGDMVATLDKVAGLLAAQGVQASLVNARFAKPLAADPYRELLSGHELVVTLEDGVRHGGYGSAVLELAADLGLSPRFLVMGLPDRFVAHGETKRLFEELGLDAASVCDRILQILGGKA
jgi:1-deoxy-D-xylulose-5-phosphate synthase